jgi:hypothetical protein
VNGYSGDAGDALMSAQSPWWSNNGSPFTTFDADHDNNPTSNCAGGNGGWWLNYCTTSSLNWPHAAIWTVGDAINDVQRSRMMIKRIQL